MLNTCKKYEYIYLYGAGNYGKTFYDFLKENGIKIRGFITTYGGDNYLGEPVFCADDIVAELGEKCLVILSVRQELQSEILSNYKFDCKVLAPNDKAISYIEVACIAKQEYFDVPKKIVENNKKILVVQLEVTFGDMIWSTAFLRELRNNYPDYTIDFVINGKFKDLYISCPYIDSVYEYNCDLLTDTISETMVERVDNYIKDYINKDYSMAFLPRLLPLSWSDSWENILLAIRLGIPNIYGHALYYLDEQKFRCDALSEFFTGIARHRVAHHEVINDLEMITLVRGDIHNNRMELWPSCNVDIGRKNTIKICVALVGSARSRSWSPEKYGVVFNAILQKNSKVEIILCGGDDAIDAAEKVEDIVGNKCINLAGKTSLKEAVAIISGCDIYLGSDTGLMHVASAFNLYVIEISASNKKSPEYWGCTPTRTGPWCEHSAVLQPSKPIDDCKYMCFKPYAHCINQVHENMVIEEVTKAINYVMEGKSGNDRV